MRSGTRYQLMTSGPHTWMHRGTDSSSTHWLPVEQRTGFTGYGRHQVGCYTTGIVQLITLFLLIVHHHHNRLRPFSRDHPGEPVPEENFWTLWCKGGLTEADTPTIRLGAIPSGLTSAHLHHSPFLQAGCPSCRPTNSVKARKATSAFGLGRRR